MGCAGFRLRVSRSGVGAAGRGRDLTGMPDYLRQHPVGGVRRRLTVPLGRADRGRARGAGRRGAG
ncbi:hypothetical protein I549_3402 [Mycobacterium avium subsp. avium 2285 (R)]|nr:hypothetical protein I549_3402 [Mycobacterium avium subsp. avium 2285 (R)]